MLIPCTTSGMKSRAFRREDSELHGVVLIDS